MMMTGDESGISLYLHFVFVVICKQLLDEVFVISRKSKVEVRGYQPKRKSEADNPYRDLDYSGDLIIVLLYIERKQKWKSCFASSLTASNKKRANLT